MKKIREKINCLLVFVVIILGALLCATPDAEATWMGYWYGDNNPSSYRDADGDGGKFEYRNWNNTSWIEVNTGYTGDFYDGNRKFRVTPASGYKTAFVRYARCTDWNKSNTYCKDYGSWTDVALPADPAQQFEFTLTIGYSWIVWVGYEQITANYTVNASVAADTDASCTGNYISPSSRSVASGSTTYFDFGTSVNCELEGINFNDTGYSLTGVSGSRFTTPAITGNGTVVVKFRPRTYSITASASGCGAINPTGAVSVVKGSSQTFSMTPSAGCSISHVRVTDPNMSYVNVDLGSVPSYTFNNVQANGTIAVEFVNIPLTASDSYCQIPPYVAGQSALKPNVLIIFDNSGSMGGSDTDGYAYYYAKTYNCTGANDSSCTRFYGYFDTDKMYKADPDDATRYVLNNTTLNLRSDANLSVEGRSGNWLNWRYMHKVDIVRKALMGGKVENRSASTFYLVTDTGLKVQYGTSLPSGIVQKMSDKVRFGMMVFRSNAEGARLANVPSTTRKTVLGVDSNDLVLAMESSETNPATSTPLAESLYEAVRYYQAKTSPYDSSVDYSTMDPIQNSCQKNFVILVTDGEPTSDTNLPSLFTDTWLNKIPSGDRPSNTTSTCTGVSYSIANTNYVPAVAFYGHNEDMRTEALGNNMVGPQNISFYTVYAFGNGSGTKTLHMAAKYGGYKNSDGNAPSPNTYPSPNLQSEWDKNSDCIPDNYLEADDGQALENGLISSLTSILAKVASGTAASILGNSEGSGANLLQAVFYPNKIFDNQTEVNWIGEMQNLWYYIDPFINNSSIREDTNGNQILELKQDKVVNLKFDGTQTVADVGLDTNGDGAVDGAVTTIDPDDVKSLWRAGRLLWKRDPASRTILTSLNGTSLLSGGFVSTNASTNDAKLTKYLQATDSADAQSVISYIRGTDNAIKYRNRTVTIETSPGTFETGVWKLGDIVSSTPRIQSSNPINSFDKAYNDVSYSQYYSSSNYKNRGLAYVGANDGMMHAFKLGSLQVSGTGITGEVKAKLTGTDLGKEEWSYIPRNALPYLKYFTDKDNYKHLFYVDGFTTLVDAAVGETPETVSTAASWRTILVGSMGLGGASKIKDTADCSDGLTGTCVKTPIIDTDDSKGVGYSSYFAFDVTNQYYSSDALAGSPTFKWEFAPEGLGYATSGAAVIRIGKDADGNKLYGKNGRWFAVIASGPTGPIDKVGHQFWGKSDQNLKIFIIDMSATGTLQENVNYWVKDTGIRRAFGGKITTGSIDADRWNQASSGNYSDDAIYVGYSKANIDDSSAITSSTTWTKGGVLRILTKENPDPAQWAISEVISDIGPVTNGVVKLQDRKNHKLWLYFGTGRYFASGDDITGLRHLIGVQEGCYDSSAVSGDKIKANCVTTTGGEGAKLSLSNLTDQSTAALGSALGTDKKGWYIRLPAEDNTNSLSAHRVISDPVASTLGTVLFTSFAPTADVCGFGGETRMWAYRYDNGSLPLCDSLKGKILVQMSTGSFEQRNLSDIFACDTGTKDVPGDIKMPSVPDPNPKPTPPSGSTYTAPPSQKFTGKGDGEPASQQTFRPLKKIVHIQEH